jgi:uncharacterized protein (DUF1501 family)
MSNQPETLFGALNRRDFIRRSGGCAALSSISILSTLLNLRLTASAMAAGGTNGDYKAMVCLFMFGGNDSRNLLAPYNAAEHAGYVDIRQGLHYDTANGVALPRSGDLSPSDLNWGMSLKPISPKSTSPNAGRDFGIHGYFNAIRNEPLDEDGNVIPATQITASEDYMRDMYNAGNLSFVCNVGSLVVPDTTVANWRQFRPVGLFSHSDEQRNWMTALPDTQSQNIGFLGRTADMLTDRVNQNSKIAMNIAMDNFNTMMIGENTLPYIITDSGSHEFIFDRYPRTSNPAHRDSIITQMTDGLLTDQFSNLLELSHSKSRRDAIDAALEYNDATLGVTLMTDDAGGFGPWPTHGVGRDMRQVARSIVGRTALQQDRQLFFLSRGGFDNHSDLIGNHASSFPQISEAVYRFWKEMEAQGLQDCVTLFSASDFERTYGPNSNKGTDHAWASNQFVVGGSQINGGDIVGVQPDATNPADFRSGGQFSTDSRGRLIPSHSVDEYLSELIKWFGDFSDSDLEMILPNYNRFSGRAPIGHMS